MSPVRSSQAAQDTLRELAGVFGPVSVRFQRTQTATVLAAKPFIDLLVTVRTAAAGAEAVVGGRYGPRRAGGSLGPAGGHTGGYNLADRGRQVSETARRPARRPWNHCVPDGRHIYRLWLEGDGPDRPPKEASQKL